jgi:hypothetical protein
MSKKRNKSVKPKQRRRKSYAQKHPRAKKREIQDQMNDPQKLRVIEIILIIIFLISVVVFFLTGGTGYGYDWYPNRHRYR